MTTLYTIITFFFIFVLAYFSISVSLGLAGWWMTRRSAKQNNPQKIEEIERKIDSLKEKAFLIAIILTFFFVTPFVVIYLFVLPR